MTTVTTRYRVTVNIDPDVWVINYGNGDGYGGTIPVEEDIRVEFEEVIGELVADYIERTGNQGSVHVKGDA